MRLARLAALGLAIGVIAGFAIALLRPRPQARTGAAASDLLDPTDPRLSPRLNPRGTSRPAPSSDAGLWTNFQQAERLRDRDAGPGQSTVDMRAARRVTG